MGQRGGETLSHTENRAARMSGGVRSYGSRVVHSDEFFGDYPVSTDGYVIIRGTRPPCFSCMWGDEKSGAAYGLDVCVHVERGWEARVVECVRVDKCPASVTGAI
jgi:hypothetical protein